MTGLVDLPFRSVKPRVTARTHAIDKGLGPTAIDDALSVCGAYLDLVKLGWGTAVVTPNLEDKILAYRAFDVEVCLGGTLWELLWLQGRIEAYMAWLTDVGLTTVEISDGIVEISPDEKTALIRRFAAHFTVISEVGSKNTDAEVSPARWAAAIEAELEAGASYVILEGRESGTVGMYHGSGEIRKGLIDEIVHKAGLDLDRLVFEAPRKSQQVELIRQLGPEVNLANIPLEDILPLETLRRGLRADTLNQFHQRSR